MLLTKIGRENYKKLVYVINKPLFKRKDFLAIFTFHQVTQEFNPLLHSKGTWTNLEQFKKEILKLNNEFKIIPLIDGIKMLKENALSSKYASIAFDDGDYSLHQVLPFLETNKIPATFFINTAYLNGTNCDWVRISRYLINNKTLPQSIYEVIPKLRNTLDLVYYNQTIKLLESLYKPDVITEKIYIDNAFLENLNTDLFHIGLHGNEHHRYSMMSYEWQKNDLDSNIALLSKYNNYRPIFALPFGRNYDWNYDTIKVCLERNLDILLSEGGLNYNKNVLFKRIPADSQNLLNSIKLNRLNDLF